MYMMILPLHSRPYITSFCNTFPICWAIHDECTVNRPTADLL